MNVPPGRVIVVGAGVFGAAAALALRERGWSTEIVDPGPLPHEDASSTDVSKVIRMDYGSDRFYHAFAEAALDGWDRWNQDWPRPLYHEDGFLILSQGDMKPAGFEYESRSVLHERGHTTTRVGGEGLRADYPHWTPASYRDGYFNPRAGWAESGAVVARLLELCQAAGVEFRSAAVQELTFDGSYVSGVITTAGETLKADWVVVAAGAWTPMLLPWMSDVIWPTGHPVLHFQVTDPESFRAPSFPPWAADISNSGWYGFPALDDGRVKVALHGRGARTHPDDRTTVSDEHVLRTRAFLREAIPELAQAPVVFRKTCMYCDSFDGDFVIARDPGREGLVIASGGSGHGFKFAPILGMLIADVLEGRDNPWAPRFAWRERGPVRTEEARFTEA